MQSKQNDSNIKNLNENINQKIIDHNTLTVDFLKKSRRKKKKLVFRNKY